MQTLWTNIFSECCLILSQLNIFLIKQKNMQNNCKFLNKNLEEILKFIICQKFFLKLQEIVTHYRLSNVLSKSDQKS